MTPEVDFKRILTAFADADFLFYMNEWISGIVGDDAPIRNASSAAVVRRLIEAFAPDLLVIDLALPPTDNSPKDKSTSTGLAFIEDAETRLLLQEKNVSVIVVDQIGGGTGVRRRIDRLGFARNFSYAQLPQEEVIEELEIQMAGLSQARSSAQGAAPAAAAKKPVLTVEVSLQEDGVGNAIIHLTDHPAKPVFAALSKNEYTSLMYMSEALSPGKSGSSASQIDWKEFAGHIGEKIYDCIFGGELHEEIEYLREKSKLTDEDMRIRFNIPTGKHRVAFETLTTRQGTGFKIIDTPMARQLVINGKERRSGPRLREADWLNVLVIDASDTGSRALNAKNDKDFKTWLNLVGSDVSFPTLSHGAGEIEMFEELDRAAREEQPWKVFSDRPARDLLARIHEVKVLNPDSLGCESPAEFADKITETLRARAADGGDWHIVHYVGHSVAAKAVSGKSGYMMLPGGMRVAPISVKKLIADLPHSGTRFVYFSSCEFGSSEVALATAQRRVPATLGFRWKVGDESALIFSQVFYNALFSERLTIDEAVRDARRETNIRTEGDDPTWVSAVFTCYGEKWHGGWGERLREREGVA